MIPALLTLFIPQLIGETISRALWLPLPGPVLGMLLLLAGFAVFPRLLAIVRPLAQGVLGHMSLLFVPAGTGVVGHLDKLAADGLAVFAVLAISTVAAIAAGALAFTWVARALGTEEPGA